MFFSYVFNFKIPPPRQNPTSKKGGSTVVKKVGLQLGGSIVLKKVGLQSTPSVGPQSGGPSVAFPFEESILSHVNEGGVDEMVIRHDEFQ